VYFNLLRAQVTPQQFKGIFVLNKDVFRQKILDKNRRRNARKRGQAGLFILPKSRAKVSPPATLLAGGMPAWMVAEASPIAKGAAAAAPAATVQSEGTSAGLMPAAVTPGVTPGGGRNSFLAEMDAELAELDALLGDDEGDE
jgi:hypothetical protein